MTDEFDPLTGELLPKSSTKLSAQTTHTEAKTFTPDLTDDELRKLAREKLSEALQAIDPREHPEMTRKLCAEVKDRLDGRPSQAIDITQRIGIVALVNEANRIKTIELSTNSVDIESISRTTQ